MNNSLLAFINLLSTLLAGSFLAGAIAQAHWRRGGTASVILWIILCGQIWFIPQAISVFVFHSTQLLYALWFGNWLVTAVAVIVFTLTFRGTSPHLLDAARMDGSGFFGIYRHIVWPMAKPALCALALILFMATWMEFLGPVFPSADHAFQRWSVPTTNQEVAIFIAASLLATLPVIAIYFARRCFFAKSAAA